MTFERILSHFQVRKRGTGKAQCICPAHVDTEASLTLTDGNDRALITSVPELHQWLRACKRENARKKSQGLNGTKKQTKDLHI